MKYRSILQGRAFLSVNRMFSLFFCNFIYLTFVSRSRELGSDCFSTWSFLTVYFSAIEGLFCYCYLSSGNLRKEVTASVYLTVKRAKTFGWYLDDIFEILFLHKTLPIRIASLLETRRARRTVCII